MGIRLGGRTRQEQASTRQFSFSELRLVSESAFQAGRELGWKAAQQLAVAGRRYRTYLILSELQRLEQALSTSGRASEAAGVAWAISTIRQQFAAATPEEIAAFQAATASRRGVTAPADPRPSELVSASR